MLLLMGDLLMWLIENRKFNHERDGVLFAVLSYMMWGIYWKLTQHESSGEILAQRVFWSYIFHKELEYIC